jgi:energy-converting hydrogenase Eha subunit C
MIMFGLCGAGRSAIGYLYFLELQRKEEKVFYGTLLNCANTFTFVISGLYFWFISRDYLGILVAAILCNGITATMILFIPESPSFLHAIRDFEGARRSLRSVARVNKVKVEFG